MSCPDVSIGSFYNVNKSCQVIVGNPPIGQGLKSPQFRGTRVIRLSQRGRPQQGFSHVGISINRELESLFNTQLIHTQVQRIVEEGEDTGDRQEEDYCCWEITYYFGVFTVLVLILSLRKLQGFLLYGFPEENIVFIVSCV